MIRIVIFAAAGASIATLALVLALMRLTAKWQFTSAVALLRLPVRQSAALVAALLAAAGLCFAQLTLGPDASDSEVVSFGELPASAPATHLFAKAPAKIQDASKADAAPLSDITLMAPQPDSGDTNDEEARDAAIEKLRQYTNGIQEKKQSIAALGNDDDGSNSAASLADVDTMIARLAKRLESEPGNKDGWRMLGWSYANTGRYAEAATAYETALSLDPQNSDLKAALDGVRGKVTGSVVAKEDVIAASENGPAGDQGQMIRGMVERLAARLEDAPNDADGWLRLMKARTVLGELELARDSLRKALAAFASDPAARDHIAAAAKELGLSAY